MFVVANTAILTQLFVVKCKHISTSISEQSQPALESCYRRDNMADVVVSNTGKIVEHCNFVEDIGVVSFCIFMVALWNRADHYIFILWFLYGRPM